MIAKVLKTQQRYILKKDSGLGIQAYSDGNDYSQKVREIIDASGTGSKCVNIYAKFISGKGFSDGNIWKKIVNRKRQTADYLENQISDDLAHNGGVAIHVNYNANFKIIELQHIPVETVRFEKLDDSGQF